MVLEEDATAGGEETRETRETRKDNQIGAVRHTKERPRGVEIHDRINRS